MYYVYRNAVMDGNITVCKSPAVYSCMYVNIYLNLCMCINKYVCMNVCTARKTLYYVCMYVSTYDLNFLLQDFHKRLYLVYICR